MAAAVSVVMLAASCSSAPGSSSTEGRPQVATGSESNGSDSSSNTGNPERGGTITEVIGADPSTLVPDFSSAADDSLIGCKIYQGLTRVDNKGEPQPLLADSWDVSDDGLSYTFHLVDARFHDGQPLTADDVKFTIEKIASVYDARFKAAADAIDAVTVVDDSTVKISMKYGFGPLLVSLSCDAGGFGVVPKHVFDTNVEYTENQAATTKPVGTGAFMLGDWVRGDHIVLEANSDYWKPGQPYLSQIVEKMIPSSSSRTIALRSGEIDYMSAYYVNNPDWPSLKEIPGIAGSQQAMPAVNLIIPNTKTDVLQDKRVRQALMVAINRQFLVDNVNFGLGDVAKSSIPPAISWAYNPDVDYTVMYPYDPDRAGKLLDEAGYPKSSNGTRFTLRFAYDSTEGILPQMAESIARDWQAVGIDVKMEGSSRETMLEQVYTNFDFDVTLQSYSTYVDPALGIARTYTSKYINHQFFTNASQYSNPTLDDLFDKGAGSADQSERAKYYYEAQKLIADELPTLTILDGAQVNVGVDSIENMYDGVSPYGDWWDGVSINK